MQGQLAPPRARPSASHRTHGASSRPREQPRLQPHPPRSTLSRHTQAKQRHTKTSRPTSIASCRSIIPYWTPAGKLSCQIFRMNFSRATSVRTKKTLKTEIPRPSPVPVTRGAAHPSRLSTGNYSKGNIRPRAFGAVVEPFLHTEHMLDLFPLLPFLTFFLIMATQINSETYSENNHRKPSLQCPRSSRLACQRGRKPIHPTGTSKQEPRPPPRGPLTPSVGIGCASRTSVRPPVFPSQGPLSPLGPGSLSMESRPAHRFPSSLNRDPSSSPR